MMNGLPITLFFNIDGCHLLYIRIESFFINEFPNHYLLVILKHFVSVKREDTDQD